jgi:hypothetical protein
MQRSLVLQAALALFALPAAAHAQVEFTPRLGVYVPRSDLIQGTDPISGFPTAAKAETKLTIGGRLGVWLNRYFGLESVVDYNKSGVQQFVNGARVAPTIPSHLFATSGRLMGKVHGPGDKVGLILSAGAGLVDRGGQFIQGTNPPATSLSGRTDFAGAGGVGFLFKISRHVAGRFDADVYTYKAEYSSAASGSTGTRRQWDLILSFGLTGAFRDYAMPGN